MRAVLKASSAFLSLRFLRLVQSFQSVFQTSASQLYLQQRRETLVQTIELDQVKPYSNYPFTTHVLTWQKRAFPFIDRDAQLTMTVYRCMFSQVVVVFLGEQYFYLAPHSRFSRLLTYLKLQPVNVHLGKARPELLCIWFWQFRNNQQRRLAYFIRHDMVCAK